MTEQPTSGAGAPEALTKDRARLRRYMIPIVISECIEDLISKQIQVWESIIGRGKFIEDLHLQVYNMLGARTRIKPRKVNNKYERVKVPPPQLGSVLPRQEYGPLTPSA